MKNKKSLIILLLVAIIGIVGLTFAYFTNSSTFNNLFSTKQYGTTYTEEFVSPTGWLPGDTTEKTIIATNSGEVDEAVRIKISEKWISHNGHEISLDKDGVKAAIINLDNSREWIKDGDYYYYKYAIGQQESTSSFIKSVTFNPDITLDNTCEETETSTGKTVTCSSSGDDYDNAVYTLTFDIETVQYDKYKQAWNTNVIIEPNKNNLLYEYVAENGEIYTGNGSTEYTNNVYFLTESTNNNVMFADYCWKIVRTTDTGGVKLIYNGEKTKKIDKLSDSDLLNIVNDETYPFNYDSNTKEWSSTNLIRGSSSTFTFSVSDSGEYVINTNVLGNWDAIIVYKDEENLGIFSGEQSIDLNYIDSSNIIKIVFSKHQHAEPQETDKVIFSIGKVDNEISYSCENKGSSANIDLQFFVGTDKSISYAGYMYNKVYNIIYKTMSSHNIQGHILYEKSNGYGPRPDVAYVEFGSDVNIETALDEMINNDDINVQNSAIKSTIDDWYESNMKNYSNYLEDNIYCNDRSIKSLGAWNSNGYHMNEPLVFNGYEIRNDLTCPRKIDSFTISNKNGNGSLKYPIGLLSVEEASLWGTNSRTNYSKYWLGTPYSMDKGYILIMNCIDKNGEIKSCSTNEVANVRPSISLKPLTKYTSGDGTVTSPFIISTN